jgi:hypothetical protein
MDDEAFRQHLLRLESAEEVTTYLAEQLGLPPAGERESSGAGTH